LAAALDLVVAAACAAVSTRQVALRQPAHLGEKLVGEDRDVGLLQAGRGEDVDHLVGGHGPGDDLADGVVQVVRRPAARRPRLGQG
jgi:hypothetical protein